MAKAPFSARILHLEPLKDVDSPAVIALDSSPRRNVPDKRLRMSPQGYVYVLSGGGYHKIGLSQDVGVRLRAFSVPFELIVEVLLRVDNMGDTERFLHHRFAAKRVRGEWFQLSDEDLEDIAGRTWEAEMPAFVRRYKQERKAQDAEFIASRRLVRQQEEEGLVTPKSRGGRLKTYRKDLEHIEQSGCLKGWDKEFVEDLLHLKTFQSLSPKQRLHVERILAVYSIEITYPNQEPAHA